MGLINNALAVTAIGQPVSSPYVSAKWAVRGFRDALPMDLVDEPNLHVCTLMPGAVDTPLFQHSANYTGRRVQSPPMCLPAERIAAAMVALARRPRTELTVGAPSCRSSPSASWCARSSACCRATTRARRHAATSTARSRDGIDGGWRRLPRRRGMVTAIAGAMLVAAPALAWQRDRRRANS